MNVLYEWMKICRLLFMYKLVITAIDTLDVYVYV